jgi:hypothetical protein
LLLSFLFRAFLQIFDLLGLEIGGLGTKIWRFWDSQTARLKKKIGGKEIASFMRSEVLRRPKIHPEIVEQREEQRKNESD